MQPMPLVHGVCFKKKITEGFTEPADLWDSIVGLEVSAIAIPLGGNMRISWAFFLQAVERDMDLTWKSMAKILSWIQL